MEEQWVRYDVPKLRTSFVVARIGVRLGGNLLQPTTAQLLNNIHSEGGYEHEADGSIWQVKQILHQSKRHVGRRARRRNGGGNGDGKDQAEIDLSSPLLQKMMPKFSVLGTIKAIGQPLQWIVEMPDDWNKSKLEFLTLAESQFWRQTSPAIQYAAKWLPFPKPPLESTIQYHWLAPSVLAIPLRTDHDSKTRVAGQRVILAFDDPPILTSRLAEPMTTPSPNGEYPILRIYLRIILKGTHHCKVLDRQSHCAVLIAILSAKIGIFKG